MTPLAIGLVGLGAILAFIALRAPIGLALAAVSAVGIALMIGVGPALRLVADAPYEFAANWTFTAIPMFLLMGTIAYHSGMTASLYRAARLWLGFLPGGLAIATNFACAGFGAASGSSLATTVAMGRIAIPEMLRYRYDPGLASAVCACAGTLGALIPPSILMVLYAIFAEQSVAKLFVAGILPGLLTAFVYAAMILVRCVANPALAPKVEGGATAREKWAALAEIWPLPVLILGVMGGIYSGFATPTEAGALGAALAFAIALLQRRMSWSILDRSVTEAIVATATIFFIAIGAVLLTKMMTLSGLPTLLTRLAADFAVSPLMLLAFTSVLFVLLGMFLEPLGLMLLTVPILLPLFRSLHLDLVWFGILVVKYIEIGLMTPPIGLNAFAVKALVGEQVGLGVIFRGIVWFLGAEIVVMALLIAFPDITLVLPRLMD
ncbi:MAG: TRAP transporter large permease subunit [Rhodospirillaceae bacterium]|nr:TRAP transporter large permease subunit [Rhodospirillaceae bacterium]